jgi:hypothetical protein
MTWTFLRQWFMSPPRAARKPAQRRKQFELEHLEGRLTPSTMGDIRPHITQEPAVLTITNVGGTVTLDSAATPSTATAQWYENANDGRGFVALTSQTSPDITVTAPATHSSVEYEVIYSLTTGTETTHAKSTVAVVRADIPPGKDPSIEPTAQTVTVDKDGDVKVSFKASDTGAPLSVQWQVSTDGGKTFTDIPGRAAHRDTYTFMATVLDDQNEYRAVFSNVLDRKGEATPAATLTVDGKPVVTTQPKSQTVATGSTVSLTAAAKGSPNQMVQWQTYTNGAWTDISGATSDTYQFTASSTPSDSKYRAEFTTTGFHPTFSHVAVVRVDAPPTVTTTPVSQSVAVGAVASFMAAANGSSPMRFVWEVSTDQGKTWHRLPAALIPDTTIQTTTIEQNGMTSISSTLSFKTTLSENNDEFRAVFSNPVGRVDDPAASGTPATLTVTSSTST